MKFWQIKYNLKAWWQRLWRRDGLANVDMWNVEHYLARKIAPALRRFTSMKRQPGIPPMLIDSDYCGHMDDDFYLALWEAILHKILDGFELIAKPNCSLEDGYVQEALELFAYFYFSLRD